MRLADLSPPASFQRADDVRVRLQDVCRQHPDLASAEEIGSSEEGRPISGILLGSGAQKVSLIAGNHSDEPVGPATLRTLILEVLADPSAFEDLLGTYRFVIVPHTNPDGEAKNRTWIDRWPDVEAYIEHAFREEPGRDMEFGFPDMRQENGHVADFLRRNGPYALHLSLHGMGFSDGALLLIERHWGFRTDALQAHFRTSASAAGLGLHDRNRQGEKGFFYLGPGFNTTPEGEAMRTFFRALRDQKTAEKFLDSSMEFARGLGGDPLCLVTELPLFVLDDADTDRYLEFREILPDLRAKLARGESIADDLEPFALRPLALQDAVRLQLETLQAGLDQLSRDYPNSRRTT